MRADGGRTDGPTSPSTDVAVESAGSRGSRFVQWFLVYGDRKHVSGLLLVGVFVALLLLAVFWPVEYRRLLTETTIIQTVFNTLLRGAILLVSIVVAVASVGISQELTSLGDQDERIETALEFRNKLEAYEGVETSPARPGQFIGVMLRIIERRADELESGDVEDPESNLQEDIDALVADIESNVDALFATLRAGRTGINDELIAGLDYDATWQLHQVHRIERNYADRLSPDRREALDELGDVLHDFMTSREYFKTLYYEREFAELSTTLLTVSLPVIIFISYVMIALDTGIFPEISLFTLSPLTVFISLAYAIALAPFTILTAYVFRAATVTLRAPAVGPFVLESDHRLTDEDDVLTDDGD